MASKMTSDVLGQPKWVTNKPTAGDRMGQGQAWMAGSEKQKAQRIADEAAKMKDQLKNNNGGTVRSTSTYTGGNGGGTYDASGVWMSYLDRLTAQAQEAYERNMAAIANAYENSAGALRGNYDSAVGTLDASAARSRRSINTDAEGAMRQAYINNILSRRDLEQSLAARGLSGGASETTRASMENNYGNARNNIDTQRNSSLAELEAKYQEALAQALQAYNSNMANLEQWKAGAEMQANNALTGFQQGYAQNFSMLAPSNEAYLAALAGLTNDMNNFTFNGATASNTYNPTSVMQADASQGNPNYGEYLAQQAIMGSSPQAIKQQAFKAYQNGSISQEDLASIINRLGL